MPTTLTALADVVLEKLQDFTVPVTAQQLAEQLDRPLPQVTAALHELRAAGDVARSVVTADERDAAVARWSSTW